MDKINDSFSNDINLSICIFPADTLHNDELSERMIDFTKFYAYRINEISNNSIPIFIENSIDDALNNNHEKYDHILFMAAGVRIFDSSIIFDIKKEILATPNYMAAGHILEWKENWYELHHQFVLVNTKNWVKAGKPFYGGWEGKNDDLVVIERSVENFHDDYTPLWIKNTGLIENRFHQKQGWNFINEALKNGFDIINWNQGIRNKRTYYYPESDSQKFLDCLKTGEVDTTLNVNQVKLLQSQFSVKNQIWVLNSEDMLLTYLHKETKFDVIALPAGGFKFLDILKNDFLKDNGKVVIYDFNPKSLNWISFFLENSDQNIKKSIKEFEFNNNFHFLGMGQKVFGMDGNFTNNFLDSLNRTFEYFGGEENFHELIRRFKELNLKLINVDLFNNPSLLINELDGKSNYLSVSNIFSTDYTNAFIGLKNVVKYYDELKDSLPNNTVLVGFNPECKYVDELILDSEIKEQLSNISGDRDQLILKHILERDSESTRQIPMNHASAHLGGPTGILKYQNFDEPVALKDFNPGRERIVMAICPSWGVIFPPYGLSKIVGVLRHEGFSCKVYDLNVQLYHNLMERTGEDYWRSEKFFYWEDSWFFNNYLLKEIESYIDKAAEKIIADNPTLVGFSMYTTNSQATLLLVKKIKEKAPNIPIVLGGPAVATESWLLSQQFSKYVSYFFKGEAEDSFVKFLNDQTHKKPLPIDGIFIGDTNSKINLDEKPYADFSDYDLDSYLHRDGVSIETSRGCVAQCSFCAETYFWRFRSMTPERVIEEMKYQIDNYGVKRFWFVDSLVNGNLKNFEKLVDLIIENKLEIGWNSYSRCDGRMSRDFIQKVADSGCTALSYGVESGSQKVLNDMRKKIEIWEIENNLRDTYTTNKIWTHVNWLIGFPTEKYIDYYHSNILIYNVRKYIHQLSPGMGCGPSVLSDLQERFDIYGIAWKERVWDNQFLGNWYTHGYKNTQLNRFIRIKLFHIWLEILKDYAGSVIDNPQRHHDIYDSYVFKTQNMNIDEYMPQQGNINFTLITEDKSVSFLSTNVANEFLPIFYGLYKIFRGFKLKVIFDPNKDITSWGSISVNYEAVVEFDVDNFGNYTYNIRHQLKHFGMTPKIESVYKWERENTHGDMSFSDTFSFSGNIKDWETNEDYVEETIHEQYRNKSKKISIPISNNKLI